MPTPLTQKVLDAAAAAVAALTPEVPGAKVFVRPAGEYDPQRDGCPAVVVCETPGVGLDRTRRIARTDTAYAVTVMLFDAQNRTLKMNAGQTPADPHWRTGWRERLLGGAGKVVDKPLPGVAESLRVSEDSAVLLDLTQYEAANLWVSTVTLRVLCRERDT
jgi:hypothetical protein